MVAFGAASNEAAHSFAEGHWRTGLIGFGTAMFAVIWAWIQNTWFASAYDTDDWIYRLLTMVQMVGVLVLALGLPPMFESIEQGDHVDNGVMVLGYVIMRTGLIALWLRVARHDVVRRRCAATYAITLFAAQIGWIGLLVADVSIAAMFSIAAVLVIIELTGPVVAERRFGVTPWHPHHISERYGLLTIITLGEVILGTVAAINAVLRSDGWTVETALVGLAGVGLTFGMWWMYFVIPSAELLAPLPQPLLRLGIWAPPVVHGPRCDGRGAPRGPRSTSTTRRASASSRLSSRPPFHSPSTCCASTPSTACSPVRSTRFTSGWSSARRWSSLRRSSWPPPTLPSRPASSC